MASTLLKGLVCSQFRRVILVTDDGPEEYRSGEPRTYATGELGPSPWTSDLL